MKKNNMQPSDKSILFYAGVGNNIIYDSKKCLQLKEGFWVEVSDEINWKKRALIAEEKLKKMKIRYENLKNKITNGEYNSDNFS